MTHSAPKTSLLTTSKAVAAFRSSLGTINAVPIRVPLWKGTVSEFREGPDKSVSELKEHKTGTGVGAQSGYTDGELDRSRARADVRRYD